MATSLSTSDVADQLNCSPATVRRIASANGIGKQDGRARSFAKGDVPKIKRCLSARTSATRSTKARTGSTTKAATKRKATRSGGKSSGRRTSRKK